MQGAREFILQAPGSIGPMIGLLQPAGPVRNIGPGPDPGNPLHQGLCAALEVIQLGHPPGHPLMRDFAGGRRQKPEQGLKQGKVMVFGESQEIRNLTNCPESLNHLGGICLHPPGGKGLKRPQVQRFPGGAKQRVGRGLLQAFDQRQRSFEIERRVAPFQAFQGAKGVVFNFADILGVQAFALNFSQRREGAAVQVPPGAPGYLRQLMGKKLAPPGPVEFLHLGEHHVVDVHIQPHADGVGGDDIIDRPVLVELNLRVAGLRRQRPHHHRRPAVVAAQQFGRPVDAFHGKGDHRGAFRQPGDLFRADIG